jgi:hypothetical protein
MPNPSQNYQAEKKLNMLLCVVRSRGLSGSTSAVRMRTFFSLRENFFSPFNPANWPKAGRNHPKINFSKKVPLAELRPEHEPPMNENID